MGPGVPAPNINVWDGSRPERPQHIAAIIPDPATGGLYNSSVPMTDTDVIFPDWAAAPIAAPWITTIGTQVMGVNSWG
jgi:hypothetical protein